MKNFHADKICFSYGDKIIFDVATLEAYPHQITGILGANGAGKTTFFDLACGLQRLRSGYIKNDFRQLLYLSQTIMTSPVLRMSDTFNMIAALATKKQISFKCALEKLRTWSSGTVDRYLEVYHKKSSICSYGEKRWFFTLTLLVLDADLIILDEPTAGVDPEFRFYIWQCLTHAAAEGAAILVSSQNIEEVAQYCDTFYILTQKKFRQFSSGDEFKVCYKAQTLDEAFILSTNSKYLAPSG